MIARLPSVPAALRIVACAIAAAAALDPAIQRQLESPLSIAVRTDRGRLVPADRPAGPRLTAQVLSVLPPDARLNTAGAEPSATVVIGGTLPAEGIPARGPVFLVGGPAKTGPRVRVGALRGTSRPVLPGWAATLGADVSGHGVAPGTLVAAVLESHGVEIDRVEHRWGSADETFQAAFSFVPPSAGLYPLQVRIVATADSRVDLTEGVATGRVIAESRRLKIMAFDPRPSWASGFIRRALEEDADFDVVSRVGASKGLDVQTGPAPPALTTGALAPFDLVLVGAPEALSPAEITALESFARVRGGTVVLIADRRPSGGYSTLVGGAFDEALLEKPVTLTAGNGTRLRASELAFPRELPAGATSLATMPASAGASGPARSPLVLVPLGAGRILFSGALDAWRYRGDDGEVFAEFWRSQIGREAMRAPRKLEITIDESAALPGEELTLHAVVRPTEFGGAGGEITVPAVSAEVIDRNGRAEPVRLWPAAAAGVFEGRFVAGTAGRYDVKVQTDSGVVAESPLLVSSGPEAPVPGDSSSAGLIAAATGGAALSADDLASLGSRLRALPRERGVERWHPMRSAWWAVAVVALLSVEWAARRRRGLR